MRTRFWINCFPILLLTFVVLLKHAKMCTGAPGGDIKEPELKTQEKETELSMSENRRIRERKDYLEAVINGKEVRRFVKVCVIGKTGAGKSSLVHRLLGGEHPCKKNTEGFEIVKRCHIRNSDGKWIVNNDATERQKRARRALSAIHLNIKGNPLPKEEITDLVDEIAEMENHLINASSGSVTGQMISGGLVECGLWDFPSETEFYPIHQSFLTLNSIYLIVADMSDDITDIRKDMSDDNPNINDSKKAMPGENPLFINSLKTTIELLFDRVHCLRDTDSTVYENGKKRLYPTIILVFTNADLYTKTAFKRRKHVLSNQLDNVLRHQAKYLHLKTCFFLSNKTDNDVELEKLRLEISFSARKMDNWGTQSPFEWIRLENWIEKIRNERNNFISYNEMFESAERLNVRKLDLFLRFQHHVGNILCFNDFIILNPEYLVYAFCWLVPNINTVLDKIQHIPDYLDHFTSYNRDKLIPESWKTTIYRSNCQKQICKDERKWVEVMEKFDILVKINQTSEYLVCITPSKYRFFLINQICKMTTNQTNSYKKTSWLCLTFEFLPPAFFHYVFAWLVQKYKPSNVQHGYNFRHGICIFDVDQFELNKLFLIMSTDTIALQYLWLEDKDIGKICSNIRKELITKVIDIEKRYELKVSYVVCFACRESDCDICKASYDQLKRSTENICLFHGIKHESEQMCMPWMFDENQIQSKLLPKEQD